MSITQKTKILILVLLIFLSMIMANIKADLIVTTINGICY